MILAALALAAAQPAAQGEWVFFFEHDEGGRSAFDSGTVQREGDIVRVWARWDRSVVTGSPFREARIHEELDCAARTVRILAFAGYAADGREVARSDEAAEVTPVTPGTVGGGLYLALCEGQASH